MATSPYVSTPETTNLNRASRVVLGPCTDGLRDTLRYYVQPPTFPSVIKEMKSNLPKLSLDQRNLILPQHGSYNGSYDDMDISLLYILLRNICRIPPHSNGWSKDPDPNDKSISANIERIRLARNKIGHSSATSLSTAEFTSIWVTVRAAMVYLDTFLQNGNKYEKHIDFLSCETMDPERDQYYLNELRKQVIEDQQTREMVVDLQKEVMEFKKSTTTLYEREKILEMTESPIPRNVREQYRIELQKWSEEDKLYHETHRFPSMMKIVRNQSFVTFVGVPGSGKSATAHHIALKLNKEGYEVVPTKDIRKLEEYCNPSNPQVFVIDDVVGVFGMQKTKLYVLEDYKQQITTPCVAKSKTLMTCREAVFNEVQSYQPLFTDESTVVKLHSSENALNDNDMKQILQKYDLDIQKYDLDVDSLLSSLPESSSRMFPLLCKLFSKEDNFKTLGEKFFMKPVQCIMKEFDRMQTHHKLHYTTLVLCVIHDNCLSRNVLNDEDFADRKSNVLEKCKLEAHTDTFKFEDALSAMEGTYTKRNADGQYSFIHDSLYEICSCHFGKQFPDQILEYMSSIYIANFVKPQTNETRMTEKQNFPNSCDESSEENEGRSRKEDGCNESKENDNVNDSKDPLDLCITLREDQYPLLATRLYKDIQKMELYDVFRNPVLKHPKVCQDFIAELETKPYAELKSLFLHQRKRIDKIMRKHESILEGSEDIDQWSEQKEIQRLLVVEFLDGTMSHVRVISWVIYYGHSEILKFIVEQTQQHQEGSELFMITRNSQYEHTDNKGTQISEATVAGSNDQYIDSEQIRLLLLSCYSGDVETLENILAHASLRSIDRTYHDDADETDFLPLRSPLTIVCRRGYAVMAHKLLKAGADINIQDRSKVTPLVAACYEGHVDVVKALVKENANLDLQDRHGDTPLVTACRKGHVNVVEILVKAGADMKKSDENGFKPLVTACHEGHANVVKVLLEAGADITELDKIGYTPLVTACRGGHKSVVELLVNKGADINENDKNGYTPLVTACHEGHVSVVELLVNEGADINESDKNGYTPLVTACLQGCISVVDELVKLKANVNHRDGKGNTPLVTACRGGHKSVVELLVNKGADINENDKNGYTPLVTACRGGHKSVVELLVNKGADINENDKNGYTPLVTACHEGNKSVVELLVKAGADINASDSNGYTPLVTACLKEYISVVIELVKMKVNVNLRDGRGNTPLVAACRKGLTSVVELLVNEGADINESDKNGYTPLVTACLKEYVSVVIELVKMKVNVNLRDGRGNTPLVAACRKGLTSVVELLVNEGADINESDKNGYTPLVTACLKEYVSVVIELVKMKVNVNLRDGRGNTPLVAACRKGLTSVVELLVNEGADINESDKNGHTPLVNARVHGHVNVADKLVELGADDNLKS